jgi:hypothetical protein
MKTCTGCNASYADSMQRCPICRAEYTPSPEVARQELLKQSWNRLVLGLVRGESVPTLRENLISQAKISDEEADRMMTLGRTQLKRVSRDRGLRLTAFGIVLGFASIAILAITGGFVIASGFVAIGFASFVVGLIKVFTGWNLADNLGAISDVDPLPELENALKL